MRSDLLGARGPAQADHPFRLPAHFALAMILACVVSLHSPPRAVAGTLVAFEFAGLGTVHVDLLDDLAPLTVDNFLSYVTNDHYADSVIHRSTDVVTDNIGVIQGGGFSYSDATEQFSSVFQGPTVNNEYVRANTPGTISMARQQNINSARSQWFFNTSDNSEALGPGNTIFGPFTVFGWIVGPGMSVIDRINGLTPDGYVARNFASGDFYNNGNFASLPVSQAYTSDDYSNLVKPVSSQMAVLTGVTIVSEDHPSFQNPLWEVDVDNNNLLDENDGQAIVDEFAANSNQGFAITGPFAADKYLDVSGDELLSPWDLLLVYNALILQDTAGPLAASPASVALVVPEPTSIAMAGSGAVLLLGWAVARRRRRR